MNLTKNWSKNEDISKHLAKLPSQQLLTFCKEKNLIFAVSLFPPLPSPLAFYYAAKQSLEANCSPTFLKGIRENIILLIFLSAFFTSEFAFFIFGTNLLIF